jgi:hypothetical protein
MTETEVPPYNLLPDSAACPMRRWRVWRPDNPSNQALCLSLSRQTEVAPGSPTCGPFGEDAIITSAGGETYHGTRMGYSKPLPVR